MVEIIIANSVSELERSYAIRNAVFVQEQCVPKELEFDGLENTSTVYLLHYNGKAVGTSRLRKTIDGLKIERFAVLKEYRKKQLGRLLMEAILKDIIKSGEYIYLNAQEQVVGFYSQFGFQICSDIFLEAGISHYKMHFKP